jgi:hypothetical protein
MADFFGKDTEVNPQREVPTINCGCILHNIIRDTDGDSDLDYCQEVTRHFQENYQTSSELSQRAEHGGARRRSAEARDIREQSVYYVTTNLSLANVKNWVQGVR